MRGEGIKVRSIHTSRTTIRSGEDYSQGYKLTKGGIVGYYTARYDTGGGFTSLHFVYDERYYCKHIYIFLEGFSIDKYIHRFVREVKEMAEKEEKSE